jgi:hypothetical protein
VINNDHANIVFTLDMTNRPFTRWILITAITARFQKIPTEAGTWQNWDAITDFESR